ncbi:hypothetical protein PGQ11_001435 [Apiospora arundinis]|uniref:Uncharacterized protein n=1 Tax=Apiospora arundinis TaxID=335852 RepID=A0ABR2JN29_9PEZI
MCSTGMLEQCRDELGSAYFRERDENKAIWKARKAQEALLDEEPKEEPMSNGRPVFDTPPGYDGYGRQFEDTLPAYGYSPLSDSGYRKEEEVKDEEMSAAAAVAAPSAGLSTPSGYSPTSDYGRKEDEVKDEEMSASAAPVAESTADLSVPIAPTPDPTPLKEKTAKRNRKRKESFDEEWKPSPYDILSGDDDKPLIKRVKKESPQAARHWWEV